MWVKSKPEEVHTLAAARTRFYFIFLYFKKHELRSCAILAVKIDGSVIGWFKITVYNHASLRTSRKVHECI